MKRGIASVFGVALVAGSLATGAFAHHHHGNGEIVEVKSQITLHNDESGVYDGRVSSKRSTCKKRRWVAVYHDQNKNGADRSDYLIGKDRTDSKGLYEVNGNQAPAGDQIVAVALPKKLADGSLCVGASEAATALGG